MDNLIKILVFIIFFVILTVFTGTVSAANWTVNPGDSIQAVINNASDNDMITINDNNGSDHTYTENIVITKKLTINAGSSHVTIQGVKSRNNIFIIDSRGNGSIIQGFTIKGATSGIAFCLSGTDNCTIIGNTITKNNYGIYLINSKNIHISENTITDNICGINPQYSTATINFNRIYGNIKFGLLNDFNSNTSAANNWWGKSTPSYINSPNLVSKTSDIYNCNSTISYSPWFSADIGFTPDKIKTASGTVKTYIETNHRLPNNVTISRIQVSMPQFLKLMANAVLNINDDLNTSIILSDVRAAPYPTENITNGVILDTEYFDIANYIKSFIDSNGHVPNYVPNISLGDSIRFESLVYMYSLILNSYNSTDGILPDYIMVTPWIAVLNPNETYNFKTQKVFNTIQSAIDDIDTQNDDTITLGNRIFSENVVINKRLEICSLSGNTTVYAANSEISVFTIGINGSGSNIHDLNIKGATNYSSGIFLDSADNCTVTGNSLTNNWYGIYLRASNNNTITENNIINSNHEGIGILISGSNNNTISGNTILNTILGIQLLDSENVTISENIVTNNNNGIDILDSKDITISKNIITHNHYGINIYTSESFSSLIDINFNRITGNSQYGLYNRGNSTINATNNWWGSNNPIISSKIPSDIYVDGGNVTYDPWLVLNISSSCDRSKRDGTCYNYIITADLTHNNQGNDTSKDSNIPDEIPVTFFTNLGTINTPISTSKGKSTAILTSTKPSNAIISVTVNNQKSTIPVNITSINMLGIHNVRTNKDFSSIQSAIDNTSALNGDIITLKDGTYTENIVINKTITLMPVSGANVILKPADTSKPVITINNIGNSSTIKGLNIDSNLCGIYLNSTRNNNIIENTLSDNIYGIYLDNSTNIGLTGNVITDNYYGTYFASSNNNNITRNNILNNFEGIYLDSSSFNTISKNSITEGWDGIYLVDSNNNNIFENNITDTGIGINYLNSTSTVLSENNITDSGIQDILEVDPTGIVMSDTIFNCGPAALATVMQNLGINVTQDELAYYAETDETGTSMYGLIQAAHEKGLIVKGLKLAVNQLEKNNIVYLTMNGNGHFSVIKDITDTTVYLADSDFGNINMTLENFTMAYLQDTLYGYTLVVTNNSNNPQLSNSNTLTYEEMQSIVGTYYYYYKTYSWRYYWTYKWVKIPARNYYVAKNYTKKVTVHIKGQWWKGTYIGAYTVTYYGHTMTIYSHWGKMLVKVWYKHWYTARKWISGSSQGYSRYVKVYAAYVSNHQTYNDWKDAPSTQWKQGKKLNYKYIAARAAIVIGIPATIGAIFFPPLGAVSGACGWIYSFSSDNMDKAWI